MDITKEAAGLAILMGALIGVVQGQEFFGFWVTHLAIFFGAVGCGILVRRLEKRAGLVMEKAPDELTLGDILKDPDAANTPVVVAYEGGFYPVVGTFFARMFGTRVIVLEAKETSDDEEDADSASL